MNPRRPPTELLVGLACGEADFALRTVLEAHLSLSPASRREFGELCAAGGAMLEHLPPERGSSLKRVWDQVQAKLAETHSSPRNFPASVPLPDSARAELPGIKKPLRWLGVGLAGGRIAVLGQDPSRQITLAVAHMPGGRVFPRHIHDGFEHAVVLAGGYEDERGAFKVGDFVVYEPGSEHGPHTLDGDDCWILFRLEGRVRFLGWRGWLQRLVL